MKLTGHEAIEWAENHSDDPTVNKYADPTEGARFDIPTDEARKIAAVDAGLIWVEAEIDASQIEALRREAGAAGDLAQVAICDRALGGDSEALMECERVISDARAMGGGR